MENGSCHGSLSILEDKYHLNLIKVRKGGVGSLINYMYTETLQCSVLANTQHLIQGIYIYIFALGY